MSEIRPAPRSIYPDQKVITAEPAPSNFDDAYLGPVLLMKSARVDLEAGTVTLPLHRGRLASGEAVRSILTDTTDENLSKPHGVPYSPKLAYGLTGKGARQAHIVFASGRVDFSPKSNITPGSAPNFFPPKAAQPGSIGDADYSPLIRFDNGKNAVFNMPTIAFDVSEQKLNTMCKGNRRRRGARHHRKHRGRTAQAGRFSSATAPWCTASTDGSSACVRNRRIGPAGPAAKVAE